MRVPIRSEPEAFRFVIVSTVVIAVCVLIGLAVSIPAGVGAFALALLLAVVGYLRAPNPDRQTGLREAANSPHRHGGAAKVRHVLVIANETLMGDELRHRILGINGGSVEVDVLAPVLTSHVHLATTDVDRETRAAQRRLDRSLAWTREQRIQARGTVGQTSPEASIEDELRDFGADEVIVVTRANETWQERSELQRLREELDVPITHLVVSPNG